MPKGERCPECGSQRWYLQDGLRFCSRGHQIEVRYFCADVHQHRWGDELTFFVHQGFIQFDVGDEEDAGKMGAVVRREKERRETEKRQLTGQEGRSLYLEAVQLLLRKQVSFLTRLKGHREELETVVRDLWDLRVRGFSSVSLETDADTGNTELEMFSSQPTSTGEEKKTTWRSHSRAQSWDPERGSDWPMPRMAETIAICYLGCVLLKIPTRLGDLYAWVAKGTLPYLGAVRLSFLVEYIHACQRSNAF